MRRDISMTALASANVAMLGIASLGAVTDGFTAVTSEGVRRAAVAKVPAAVPDVEGIDQSGRFHGLFADPGLDRRQARVAIVNFVYTRCADVCSVTGAGFQRLQEQIKARKLQDRVRLVSVSFDPAHDTPESLARYGFQHSADPSIWTIEVPRDSRQLSRVLTAFGVVVLGTPDGGFQHNSAFELLDTQGRLARIVDSDSPELALGEAVSLNSESATR